MKTKIEKIQENLSKAKLTYIANYYEDDFIRDAKRYIQAIKENRVICNIESVSASGMSRNIKFLECKKNTYHKNYYNWLNFFAFFKVLGYTESRKKDNCFSISGCGMDMIFHTNYSIIHRLHRLGFINKKQCDKLAQNTPTII